MGSKNAETTNNSELVEIHVMKGNEYYLAMSGVCEKLSISAATGRRWKKEGKLPDQVDINGVQRYRDSDIEKMIDEQNERPEDAIIKASKKLKNKG